MPEGFLTDIQRSAKRWALGCVNPASWLPLAAGGASSRNLGTTRIHIYFAALGSVGKCPEDGEREVEGGVGHCAQPDTAVRDEEAGGERGARVAAESVARGAGNERREGAGRATAQADRFHAGRKEDDSLLPAER